MSVRRSSRTTKGFHSSRLDDEPQDKLSKPKIIKKKSTTRKQPAYVPIVGESVRCLVCASTDLNYDEDDDPFGPMVECENCKTWQHIKCYFKDAKEEDIPDDYKCDVCDPDNPLYANKRRKMSYARYLSLRSPESHNQKNNEKTKDKGEDEEETKDQQKEEIEGLSESEEEEEEEEVVDAGALEESDDEYEESKKRAHSDDEFSDNDTKPTKKLLLPSKKRETKKQKQTIKFPSIESQQQKQLQQQQLQQPNLKDKNFTKTVNQPLKVTYSLDSLRKNIVKSFETKLVEFIPKTNNEELLNGKTLGELAKSWAEILENGLYGLYPNDQASYKQQARTLLINFKNSHLIKRVIDGEFTIEQLPTLSNEDMLTASEKKKLEEAKQKAIENVVIKNDTSNLPKIRYTLKGVEIVGDTDTQFDINDRRNKEVEKIQDLKKKEEGEEQNEEEGELRGRYGKQHSHTTPPPNFMMNATHDEEDDYAGDLKNENNDNHDEEDSFVAMGEESTETHNIMDDDIFDNILNDGNSQPKEKKDTKDKVKEKTSAKPKVDTESLLNPSNQPNTPNHSKSKRGLCKGTLVVPDYSLDCEIDFVTSTIKDRRKMIDNAHHIINDFTVDSTQFATKGRLPSSVADTYLDKIIASRDLYLFEIKGVNFDNATFMNIWSVYHSTSKYAVIDHKLRYVKDIYLLCYSRSKMIDGEESPSLISKFSTDMYEHLLDDESSDCKMYILFVVQRDVDRLKPLVSQQALQKEAPKDDAKAENDDDYDPTISTISKPNNTELPNDSNQTPDINPLLADLVKNLGS